jgi:hypothetical protein
MSLKKIISSTIAAAVAGLSLSAAVAGAAPATGFTLFGAASLVSPGHNSSTAAELVSDMNAAEPYGGVDLNIPNDMTFGGIETLSTDFNVTNDDCEGGSPRFQIALDTNNDGVADGNAFVYLGTAPNYTDCPLGWQSSGNLAEDADFVDMTQFGGAFYDTFANAQTIFSTAAVLDVHLVTDAGWAQQDQEQTVQADNITLNNLVVTFEPVLTKEDCKKGGWQQFTGTPGPFKNQGQCVSYFARQQSVITTNTTEF